MKCYECGRTILHPYYFNNRIYGIECWKKIALPEILKNRKAKEREVEMHDWNIAYCYVSVLKTKDMSKIKSSFKRQFILSVIRQFNERGFLTHKQLNIIGDMFNNKDNKNYFRLAVELGLNDKQNLIDIGMMTTNDFKKEEK